jgi:neurofibromin 1
MEERVSRYPAFDQLGDPRIPVIGKSCRLIHFSHRSTRILGRVAFQKKYRRLLGHSANNGPMHLAVWQELYFRLRILGESIKEASESPEAIDPDLGHPMITLEVKVHSVGMLHHYV